ncbi:MAG: valine--tRNA ligase [Gemmatimonadota bacterium]|nr:valine--tRNA ligase [Gemmatimonadota bacterium]
MTTTQRATELPAQYDPGAIERDVYARWTMTGAFRAHAERSARAGVGGDRAPYVIVIPPPNVTAILHMGHGLNNTVQDVVVRWRRMCGDEALWVPGTDHAGIATQNIVERLIKNESGMTRFDLGREEFVARTASFVEETGGTILQQLAAIGASCDWTRTAYTLSPELSRAVREAFVRLHERGLIYRGHRVIHWCPRCLTSLSDEEAEHADTEGKMYRIRYPFVDAATGDADPRRGVSVATTRPETMLGDVAVAVHPDDERYRDFVGRHVLLPIASVPIPVIADEYTDPAFGTGAVKITSAHDPNDFEVGLRHGLPTPVIMSPTATMQDAPGNEPRRVPSELEGLDRSEARTRIVQLLQVQGLLENVETHHHSVRRCYRCDTVVEPRLSDQWFVRMEPLARPALRAVQAGEIRILPDRWIGVYTNWMENIRDWNISRQLWWGHRIPVWYCDSCGANPIVSRDDVAACPNCAGPVRQDEDVLDTWFSSWLWPFSTLGWPNREAPDLRAFYPTDLLVTAPEILFFWVARMIMAGYEFLGERPFHSVYLHGTVRDTQHRKMSKSLGNGIDPLDVVQLYGADALRYTVIAGMGMGADIILDPDDLEKSFTPGRNFATKLWNIGRFLLGNIGGEPVAAIANLDTARLTRADLWILHRLDVAIIECDAALGPARPTTEGFWREDERAAGLRLNEYVESARRFVWNELADWYVETAKARLAPNAADRDVARAVLVHAFDTALRLLHPIVPFITETLWQRLPGRRDDDLLATARWPERGTDIGRRGREFELVQEAVMAIRQLRSEYALPPGKEVEVVIVRRGNGPAGALLVEEADVIGRLTRATLRSATEAPREAATHALLGDGTELVMPLGGIIDVEKECARLSAELTHTTRLLEAVGARLANDRFVSRAPAHVVDAERSKERELAAKCDQLAEKVAALCAGS